MALYTMMWTAVLGLGAVAAVTILDVAEANNAAIDERIATERQEARAAARAEQRGGLEDQRARYDRVVAAYKRCRKDHERARQRARRGGAWREPSSCRRYEALNERWRERKRS